MHKLYSNKKNLVAAIRRLEQTEPTAPIKGRGNDRIATKDGEMLATLLGKEITACRHVCRVFARRSKKAKWNKLQWGGDEDFVSPEMAKLLSANEQHVEELRNNFRGHQEWTEAVA